MRVFGYLITDEVINKVITVMKEKNTFTIYAISRRIVALRFSGCGWKTDEAAYRAAERIIQQQKKAGNIEYDRKLKMWRWIKE